MNNDLIHQAAAWLDAGEAVALATIVRIRGSSAQPLGARMVMTSDNRFVGAVSGGCVETDVYEAACDVLAGDGPLLLHYKHVENPLVEIGLSCDGQIDVLVERLDRALFDLPAPPTRILVTQCAQRAAASRPLHRPRPAGWPRPPLPAPCWRRAGRAGSRPAADDHLPGWAHCAA